MLTEDRKNAIKTLKGLVEICNDGSEGFRTAAENINDSEYKTIFLGFAQQRAMFSNELESEIRRLGANEDKTNLEGIWNDVVGAVHRGWINLKSAVSSGDSKAILDECERGEDAAVDAYEDALEDTTLPLEVSTLLRSQYSSVKEAHDRVRNLRNLERIEH